MNILKRKALALIESQLAKTGEVLEVRRWTPGTFYEVDLYLPGVNMDKWTTVQHMKCKVADYVYRDYTPAKWDAETATCTLYIDAAHPGEGSKWVSELRKGDQICYVGIGGTNAKPMEGTRIMCLGDHSCVGHFLALEQLAGKENVSGALVIPEAEHRAAFLDYFDTLLEAIPQQLSSNIDNLHNWLQEQQLANSAVFIAGNGLMVTGLKKRIKALPNFDNIVRVQGFWW